MRLSMFLGAMILLLAPAVAAEERSRCRYSTFSSKTGDLYLEAEALLFVEENTSAALEKLKILRKRRLNCYELKFVVQLAAAAYFRDEQYLKAAQALEEALETGALKGEGLLQAYYQVAQIYLQENHLEKAKHYLDSWLEAGAVPTADQYMQLAILHNKIGDNWAAAAFLESVLAIEPKPEKTVMDFVVFIYNETNQKKKLADFLRHTVIPLYPKVKRYWEVAAGLYYEANNERSAFETIKAMYLAGLLTSEEEIMRVVNFYNQFDTPFAAATILATEIKNGRIKKSPERLGVLASLFQVAREYKAAIPALQELAEISNSGMAYERLGRSYFELGQYAKAAQALEQAITQEKLKNPGQAWSLIGRAWHNLDEREKARNSFGKAGKFKEMQATAQAWLSFMDDEDYTSHVRKIYEAQVAHDELSNIKKNCSRIIMLGGKSATPAECDNVTEQLKTTSEQLAKLIETLPEKSEEKS